MELLRQFKEDGYFTAILYHLLTQNKMVEDKEVIPITPSRYLKEMRMSYQERLQHLNNIMIDNLVSHTGNKPGKPVLNFTPRIIMFQNFKPNDRIVAKFSVKNISNGPTFLNMVFKESSNFFIKPSGAELLSRLAPGISVTFNITFLPVQHEDYVHRVSFYTDVDQYVLPLIGMGPRPIFDFPDEIVMPPTALKVETFVLISVHNVSTVPAGFTISTKCPFTVHPKSAYLHPDKKVELKIGFKTMHLGETVGKLIAEIETDEVFHIKVRGTTHLVNIELEKAVVRFLDTYNTMARQQTLKLTNRSNEMISYMCMKNDSVYNDFEEKIKLATIFYDVKDSESAKYRKLVQYDVLSSDEHERVYTRIFFDEIQALVADETLYFHDLHFSITPIKGKLWPNETTEITITFAPKQIGEFNAIAYLDIDGIYDRVALKLNGTSLPPYIHLNLETLNIDAVYINTTYNYEIVAINKGHINGVIVYKEVPPLFGSVISCSPELHCLRPGEKQLFTISFMNSNQGPFFEEINFVIRDSDVVRKLYLKGEVIYPTLKFSIPCLDFGNVSVGVPKTLQVEVINESVVNVNASIKISTDGPEVSGITLEDCEASQCLRFEVPSYPKEFQIEPSKIELSANSRFMLKVTLTANLNRAVQTHLELELDKSDSPPIVLPLTYTARVPTITPAPDIKLRACFLDFAYNYDIIISSNEFWGFFTVDEEEADNPLKVEVAVKRGIIRPNTTISLPISITTAVLGYQERAVKINLFGYPKQIQICSITGNGVRPIVTCMPMFIHWGQVKLLTKSQKILTLCNDSPVTVYFRATLLNRDGRWQIKPTEGQIDPESETELVLTLYLVDADTYTNKAVIQLEKVRDIFVPLSATGIGTSIVVGEERDKVDLGRHFVKLPVDCNVTVENCGTRLHSLEWSEYFKAPKNKPIPSFFFNLEPRVFKLGSGEKTTIRITGMSTKMTTVREKWFLIGSVEGINKKELLLECMIIAEFVEPKVDLSTSYIDLRYDYGPYSEYYKLTDIITIKNVSKLPLDIDLSVKLPFAIVQKSGTYKIPSHDQDMCCCISYNESDLNIANLIAEVGPRRSKAFIDCLTLKPVEPCRKEPLHFFEDINKIKMAFNLTHAVEERLEDQEVMKIQVVFDTTKHLTLKSKVYSDVMRIKFKGHKNKDAVRIQGRINFPNVYIATPKLDFQCILNGSYQSKTIKIQNTTPLMVCYKFKWKKCSIRNLPVAELPKISYDVNQLNQMKAVSEDKEPTLNNVEDIFTGPSVEPLDDTPKETEELDTNNGDGEGQLSTMKVENDNISVFIPEPDSEMEFKMQKLKILKKITPMLPLEYDHGFPWAYKFSKSSPQQIKIYINDIFQLTPHRGMLKPNDVHNIHVMFTPKPNISVKAILECDILGGPPEFVTIYGQSSDLKFKLNTQSLNFKIRSFHKPACEQLIISNISQLPFQYKTYLNEPESENDLNATIAEIVPPEKVLEPEEDAEVSIMMQVGAVGFFHHVFLLEIGHQPHIPIETFGWGVIPQVYISLPRVELTKLRSDLCYSAVATLTTDYLEAVQEIFRKGPNEHLNSPQMDRCFEDPDLQDGWHICSAWDGYPSIMDIELAIERILAVRHIKNRPEILTMYSTTTKIVPIPGFQTTPYIIDYGVVITGNTVSCVIEVINYGPIQVKLAFSKSSAFKSWLYIKLCGKLNPGESGKIEVTFMPTSEVFKGLEENVETCFYLEVPYGVTIPVQVKALCAVPYLKSNVETVDFGHVRCGDKIISSIPLRNVGKPTCVWYVTLKLKSHGPNPLVVLDSSGHYEPGEGGWLSISFKPTMEMTYEAVLVFRFHMNPHKLIIPVIGHGVFPHAHIIGPKVVFPPTLPWAQTTEQYFGITNPCPFPIEIIVPHIDEKWKEEDEIFQLLYKYYNKPEEILVPAIKPGAGMPAELQNFYTTFKASVKKAIEEETPSKTGVKGQAAGKKQAKSPKGKAGAGSKEKDKDLSPKKYRTEAEIVADQIKSMKEQGYDPLNDCMQGMESEPNDNQTDKYLKGLLLFLHGSPCEEMICKEMAYSLGMALDIPTVSFDHCVVEALCVCDCLARTVILNAINESWEFTRKPGNTKDSDDAEELEDIFGEHADEFEIIQMKIDFLANNKNIATPRSKASDKKKKEASAGGSYTGVIGNNPTSFFQEDLLNELLTEFFKLEKFQRGFVMDSLTSIVLRTPSLVLTTTLKAKRTIYSIHLVLCQSDFTKWAQAHEEAQREAETFEEQVTKVVVYDEEEIKNIVTDFEEMSAEEYENASTELRNIYIQHGLEERRRKYYDKHGITEVISSKKETKSARDISGVVITAAAPSDSKKKLKKDDNKGKITNEYNAMQLKYNDYMKNVYESLVSIASNWIVEECDVGFPPILLNGQVAGATHKKSKKKSDVHIVDSEVPITDRGFPLTLLMCPCTNYKEALVNMFLTCPYTQERLQKEEVFDVLKLPVNMKEYTVLLPKTLPTIQEEEPLQWYYLAEPPLKKCECNQITDLHLLDDTTQDNVMNILSKWHCICGKKVTSSQTSTSEIPSMSFDKMVGTEEDEFFYPLPLASVKSIPVHGSRLILQPGDLVRCKYAFSPTVEGNFSLKRYIDVVGWPESRVDVSVSGICDLPRLDNRPKKMFDNFVRRTLENNVYKLTYLDDQKQFEFGPIFIGKNRIYEEENTINLKNASLLTANVDIEFMDDTDVFRIDKNFITLEPGCRGKLTISAAPTVVGTHKVLLLFCIKDNPDIVRVSIVCSGVMPVVEVLPLTKSIDYGRLLLYRREDDRFIIKNDSILPVMWKVRNPEDFLADFIISKTTGIVPRHENQVVPVTYIACNVGIITQLPLIIDIYDELGRGEPLIVDVLFLSGECYDVMVECAYENPDENFLNYGYVKVNSTIYRDMYLLNRGKYNIYYKLKKVKNFPEPSLLKSFEAIPEFGIIPPTLKLIAIEFECTPTTSINLNNVPAYTCSLLDGSKDQVVVAKFPVCVTIASFYNTFTLFPLGELNFHVIPVGSGVMRDVILNNTSKCPFNYEIVVPEEYRLEPPDPTAAAPKTDKNSKLKNPPLKCGNFLIVNEDNLLAPGTSRTIQIQFLATAPRKFEETIHFIVSDTCPAEASGVPLRLVGVGAMPVVDFWNLENTFREHLIVRSMSEYKVPESSPHCVFEEQSVTLHFFCVTVNSTYCGAIDLYNSGVVASILKMNMHYQSNTDDKIFYVEKDEMQIEPLMHKRMGIYFSPKALEEYRAVLDIKLKLLHDQEQSYKICLIGSGVIPRIRLLKPPLRQHRLAVLQFPVTCLGSMSNKEVRFKNICTVRGVVTMTIMQVPSERPVFWMSVTKQCKHMVLDGTSARQNEYTRVMLALKADEVASVQVYYNPLLKGRTSCDIKVKIENNPYEFFTVLCEAEAFIEDVILIGLEMMSMEMDLDLLKDGGSGSNGSGGDNRKKSKSAPMDKRKSKDQKKTPPLGSKAENESSVLKYLLDFGGCELCVSQKRSVVMLNNSEKVYKFKWDDAENIIIKPSAGYISPGEEKDLEIMFFSMQPAFIRRELLSCILTAISDDSLTLDSKGSTWDNRQILTVFERNPEVDLNERYETPVDEQPVPRTALLGFINIIILYSATTEYTKYSCNLDEEKKLKDTFIYQKRSFKFKVENVGNVPLRLVWNFVIDDEYPARIDKRARAKEARSLPPPDSTVEDESLISQSNRIDDRSIVPEIKEETSKETLFSGSFGRDSVDTWFEADLPFTIVPTKECLKPRESKTFEVTFAPLDAFDFKVRLKSSIDNLDPYDQNITCKILAKSLIPYVHLDIEESDYITHRRKVTGGIVLPPHMLVLEFNVLGWGCFKKSFHVINPTSEAYEFVFELCMPEKTKVFIPMHCNIMKGHVEGGTSTEVTFTFAPTAPGACTSSIPAGSRTAQVVESDENTKVYESQWRFMISKYNLTIPLMVVGTVREPDVVFVPTILLIRNSLVGFTTINIVKLKNNENEPLDFEFKGNSLCNETGAQPILVEPDQGVLKPKSETSITIYYTPINDGPLSFKIFCHVSFMMKFLTLCINALSHLVKPRVTYYIIGSAHLLLHDVVTKIHLEQTASTYLRKLPFKIKNDGSATFFYEWNYTCSPVKKYLTVSVEPRTGYLAPNEEVDCILNFHLKHVPVEAYPVSLSISDGPEYHMYIYAEIEKPLYHFSCKEFDFGKCIVNAPDSTYKKNLAFTNDDKVAVTLDLATENVSDLYVDYRLDPTIEPKQRAKIPIYFRPKSVKPFEFKLQFWVNSLCEEIITIRGEGVPLLLDLYEGCQKSFDLGPVKVGQKIVREIQVMNHSKVPVHTEYRFQDVYDNSEADDMKSSPGSSICLDPNTAHAAGLDNGPSRVKMVRMHRDEKLRQQSEEDVKNTLASMKVVPAKCVIPPHGKVTLKLIFKPVALISTLSVQLNAIALEIVKPLVMLSGSATGMHLCFSNDSLQFGRVRRRGCKILKVMLHNKGDFGAHFFWQPLTTEEFTITPLKGYIAARSTVTFTVTFRPHNYNPFVKVWASCNIENYQNLDLALYAACVDVGILQNQSLYMECPVRDVTTEYVIVTNPTDENWLVLSEVEGSSSFETLREFQVDANSPFEIPIHFKPKTIGKHECQVLFSPLGESALFVTLIGAAVHPNPNGELHITVPAKKSHTELLLVYNITEKPESYMVTTEMVRTNPEKFEGYYEIKCPELIKTWGEAAATCQWTFVCFEPCEMELKAMFINVVTREYQYYVINCEVTPSDIMGTLKFMCRARESVQREMTVANPLGEDSDFHVLCDKLACSEVICVKKHSEKKLTMTFSPLVVGEFEDFLTIDNYLVGTYTYRVEAICLPAKEKNLEFTAMLGSCIPLRLRVTNKSDSNAVFITSVNHPSITAEKEYTLPTLEKGKFLCWFEPTELGVQKIKVSFDSSVAGEFVFNIKGIATEPKPQGPYDIKAGGFTAIKFKNVFMDTRTFRISVDREEFYVKSNTEQLKAKKEIKVLVYLNEKPARGWSEPMTGCLTIESVEVEPRVQWIYFLQGIP